MTPYENALSQKHRQVLQVLRPILVAAKRAEPNMREIVVTEHSIREFSHYDGLTRAILEHDIPMMSSPVVLDHYTTGTGFKGILESQQLWLAPITLRLNHGELGTFAWEHGLNGYVDADGKVRAGLVDAAADLFYTSFTQPPTNDHLWSSFGDSGNGYRLRFEVTPGGASQVRAIRYQGATTLLKQVNDALVQAGLPRFVLKGVSRIGAFYLPSILKPENEIRLLAKRFPGGCEPTIAVGQSERWPVPIGLANKTAELKLIEIGVRNLSRVTVQSRLPAWCNTVPVVAD